MKLNYLKFLKDCAKMVKNVPETRSILKGVHHAENGDLSATNSHVMYYVDNHIVNAPKNVIIDPVSGEEIEGNFPNTKNLLMDVDSSKNKLYLHDVEQLIKVLKAMQALGTVEGTKKDDVRIFLNGRNKLELLEQDITVETGIECSYTLLEQDGTELILNLKYVLDALEMFVNQNRNQVYIHVFGNNRPLVFTTYSDEGLYAAIMPIRKGAN